MRIDEFDMIEFFESDPKNFIQEDIVLNSTYSINNDMFSMSILIDILEQQIYIDIRYRDSIVFSAKFDNVLSIRKSDDFLIVDLESERRLIIKKYPCFGVIVEEIGK